MRRLLPHILALGLGMAAGTYGAARPTWVAAPPREDATHRFYLGRCSVAPSESAAFAEATRDAYEQAVRENFGFRARVESQSYETSTAAASLRRIDTVSPEVQIRDFELVDSHLETAANGRHSVWALYRYARGAIAREKARLVAVPEAAAPFSEIGGARGPGETLVEVVTRPAGATVIIDGEPAGLVRTPVRFLGTLAAGRHSIVLDHPRYSPVAEEFIVVPGGAARIEKILVKATARLSITTSPPGAVVLVDGKPVGISPTDAVPVLPGTPVRVEVSHPETEGAIRDVVLERDGIEALRIELIPRAGLLAVSSVPPGASVLVDGEPFGTAPTGALRLAPGRHRLTVEANGFAPHEQDFDLGGGERRALVARLERDGAPSESAGRSLTGTLTDVSEPGPAVEVPFRFLVGVWGGGLSDTLASGGQSPMPAASIFAQARLFALESVRGAVELTGTYFYRSSRGAVSRVSGSRLAVGLPLFLGRGFFVSPEYAYLSRSSVSASGGSASLQQHGVGGSIGVLPPLGPEGPWAARLALGGHRFTGGAVSFTLSVGLGVGIP